MSRITALAELREGQEVPPLEVEAGRDTLIRYAGASDDYAYQHWDRHRMIELGFKDVVVHGWLTFAYMTRAVTDWVPREAADIRSFAVRYRRTMLPGVIRCGGQVVRVERDARGPVVDLDLWARDADGEVTTTATMTLGL
jgi:acyl dehydratase